MNYAFLFSLALVFFSTHESFGALHKKSYSLGETKELELHKLREKNKELVTKNLDLSIKSASSNEKQLKQFGKMLASLALEKKDEYNDAINLIGSFIQEFKFREDNQIEFSKEPIDQLWGLKDKRMDELEKKVKQLQQELDFANTKLEGALKLNQNNIDALSKKQVLIPFISGLAFATGGFAAFYFTYLKKK